MRLSTSCAQASSISIRSFSSRLSRSFSARAARLSAGKESAALKMSSMEGAILLTPFQLGDAAMGLDNHSILAGVHAQDIPGGLAKAAGTFGGDIRDIPDYRA